VLPRAEAATNTIQQKVTVPPCMRRVTVTSKPCGATIYVDSIQVGRTPLSFPMPPGRYTLILLAPGHQQYSRRILVPDAPLEIEANLVPSS
jgi:PEGA domain-containing protein